MHAISIYECYDTTNAVRSRVLNDECNEEPCYIRRMLVRSRECMLLVVVCSEERSDESC